MTLRQILEKEMCLDTRVGKARGQTRGIDADLSVEAFSANYLKCVAFDVSHEGDNAVVVLAECATCTKCGASPETPGGHFPLR